MTASLNELLVCLGSNALGKEEAVARAATFLERFGDIIADSGPYLTPPEGAPVAAKPYWNRILRLETPLATEDLHRAAKAYESGVRAAHTGEGVAVDIDIVADSTGILRPRDYKSFYFTKGLAMMQSILVEADR